MTAKDIVSELHKKLDDNIVLELDKKDWTILQKCIKMFDRETIRLAIASYPNRRIDSVGPFFLAICKNKAAFSIKAPKKIVKLDITKKI